MKKSFISLFVALLTICASAQDIIVKNDGSIIRAVVTKVSESDVEYRNFGASSERIYSIKTSSIVSINYEDGTIDKFSSEKTDSDSVASESGITKANPDIEKNKELIEAYNSSIPQFSGRFTRTGAKANCGLVYYAFSENSTLASNDLIISAEAKSQGEDGSDSISGIPNIIFTIANRTDRTLYLDLGNTFLSVGGESQAYYTPGAQSTTTTTSKGTSVNLGAVAGAMGVGGALGTLASGVNVGGGNSTSSNNVVFSQRIVAVAPFSKLPLAQQSIQDDEFFFTSPISEYVYINNQERLSQGHPVEYSEETSPSKLSFFLSYSYSEDCVNLKQMSVNLYAQRLYGLSVTNFRSDFKYVNISPTSLTLIKWLYKGYIK